MDRFDNLTDIQKFYRNTTVFITGATGFVGKLVLEKVLRALPVKKVYILVRSKKNVPAEKRFNDIFESPAFDLIKRTNKNVLKKVVIMEGDCSLPMLGLHEKDQNTFRDEVDVIFHAAATVRFDEQLKKATLTNIRATKDLITLAKRIKKLKTFVYIGTGFSNCVKTEIKEEVYPSTIKAEDLITTCEILDNDLLDSLTPKLIGEWPNTYTFTKQVTEEYIDREAKDLPICITRPAIILSTMSEPVVAFVDNIFTLAGFVMIIAFGMSRIFYVKNILLDIVPVDIVVNQCIAAGWQTGINFKKNKSYTPVYNISSVMDNPISTDDVFNQCEFNGYQIPSPKLKTYPLCFRTTCKYNYLFFRFIFHTMTAYIFDLVRKVQGKKTVFVELISKLHKFQEAYEYFVTHEILPHTENTHKMLRKMTHQDKELFNCDITSVQWDNYFGQYMKGLRFYLVKESMDNLPEGRKQFKKIKMQFIIGCIIVAIIVYGLGKLLLIRVLPFIFGIVLNLLRGYIC